MLHCLYSPPERLATRAFADALAAGDAVLLLGSAVVAAAADYRPPVALPAGVSLHALAEDIAAHGVKDVADSVSVIDYGQWVDLAAAQPLQCLWD
jgi:sulfur relay protein TusB/DsrH